MLDKKWMVSKNEASRLLDLGGLTGKGGGFTPADLAVERERLARRPDHPCIISVHHTKGGVGKTTIAYNLAANLARAGFRTLLIDLDPSGGATKLAGLDPSDADSVPHTMLDVFMKRASIDEIAVHPFGDEVPLSLVTCSPAFAQAPTYLTMQPGADSFLKRSLRGVEADFVVMDMAPNWNILHVNMYLAVDMVIAPTIPEGMSVQSFEELKGYVLEVVEAHEIDPPPIIVLPNNVNQSIGAHRKNMEAITGLGAPIAEDALGMIVVPQDATIKTANDKCEPVAVMYPASKGGYAIRRLASLITQEALNG